MMHELKTWPHYFQASWVGDKSFEIRLNDREFHERDEVMLKEFDPVNAEYTGRFILGFIRYLSEFEQKPFYVVFEITKLTQGEE